MSKEELRHCPFCGSPAKVRYNEGSTWIECKRKCGAMTHKYPDFGIERDPEARALAVEEWNERELNTDD